MPDFSYQVRQQDSVCVVEVSGDVDMAVHQQLEQVLEPLVAAGDVVLDCSRVTFFDSMALRVAVKIMHRAGEAGTTFALVPSQAVSRVLKLAGLTEIFTIREAAPAPGPGTGTGTGTGTVQ